jgi:hypothetical protein
MIKLLKKEIDMFSFPGGIKRVIRDDFFNELDTIERDGVAKEISLKVNASTLRVYLMDYKDMISANSGFEHKTATKKINGKLWVAIIKTDKRLN